MEADSPALFATPLAPHRRIYPSCYKYSNVNAFAFCCLDNTAAFFHDSINMDSSCFAIPYLESLSTGELVMLAEKCGLDIPIGLERVFIIEELYYLGQDSEAGATGADDLNNREIKEAVALPGKYNISFIETLVRDPLWVFVFWEIKGQDLEINQKAADFSGYFLRVIPLKGESLQPDTTASFTVAVNTNDSAWYVGFSPEDGRSFKIELCSRYSENCTVLAESRPFTLPRLIRPQIDTLEEDIQAVYKNPLVQLSGVNRFSLIHSEDRLPRPRVI
jgi:hypothetical protein